MTTRKTKQEMRPPDEDTECCIAFCYRQLAADKRSRTERDAWQHAGNYLRNERDLEDWEKVPKLARTKVCYRLYSHADKWSAKQDGAQSSGLLLAAERHGRMHDAFMEAGNKLSPSRR